MSWARFSDDYFDNPKVRRAGAWGMRLHMASIIWNARHWQQAQGCIPREVLPLLVTWAHIPDENVTGAANALLREGLWEQLPDSARNNPDKRRNLPGNAWLLHDWREYLRPEDRLAPTHARAPRPVPSREKNDPIGSSPSTGESLSLLTQEETRRVDLDLQVFIVWQETANKPLAKFLDKRKAIIKARRKEGYTQDDLLDAVRGWQNDDWDRRKYRNAIEDLINSGANLERFRDFFRNGKPLPTMTKPNGAAARAAVYDEMAQKLRADKQLQGRTA